MTDRLSPRELAAWRGLLRVHARLLPALNDELQAEHGIALGDYEVLLRLSEHPEGLRMTELANAVLRPKNSLTRIASGLAEQGLIERCATSADGRGTVAKLTARGTEVLARAQVTHLAGVRERFLGRLSDDQVDQLAAAWAAVDPAAVAPAPGERAWDPPAHTP